MASFIESLSLSTCTGTDIVSHKTGVNGGTDNGQTGGQHYHHAEQLNASRRQLSPKPIPNHNLDNILTPNPKLISLAKFLQRVRIARNAERCYSQGDSVCLSVRHVPVLSTDE